MIIILFSSGRGQREPPDFEHATCGLYLETHNWHYGLSIPIKAVLDGINDGDHVRDVSVNYHIYYKEEIIVSSQLGVSTQVGEKYCLSAIVYNCIHTQCTKSLINDTIGLCLKDPLCNTDVNFHFR